MPASHKCGTRSHLSTHPYHDADSHQVFEILFYSHEGCTHRSIGHKRPGSNGSTIWDLNDTTLVPYNLVLINDRPKATVVITATEYEADYLLKLGKIASTCCPSGTQSWPQLAEHLAGRDVIIAPPPGHLGDRFAAEVGHHVAKVARRLRILHLPDLTDGQHIDEWAGTFDDFKAAAADAPEWGVPGDEPDPLPSSNDPPPPEPEAFHYQPPAPPPPIEATPRPHQEQIEPGVWFLGHDRKQFFFYPRESGQVISLTSGELCSVSGLINLAPIPYWEAFYQNPKGINSRQATSHIANRLIRTTYANSGIYDPKRVRGRGAWWDDGRFILNCGNRLIVDWEHAPELPKSSYIYEMASAIDAPIHTPLPPEAGRWLLDLVKELPWKRPLHAYLFLGWASIAPLSGLLDWRPHLYLLGESGGGKSWSLDHILTPLLGTWCTPCQSMTSEAGIRHDLRNDALPVVFDEVGRGAEGEMSDTMLALLALVRQSSVGGGAPIKKGGSAASGGGVFFVRSCFCLASINTQIDALADQSRFCAIEMERREDADSQTKFWKRIVPEAERLNQAFTRRFRARVMHEQAAVRQNARIFSREIAAICGSQRQGDQVGAILAGLYAVTKGGEATANDINTVLPADMIAELLGGHEDRDEDRTKVYRYLMERVLQVEANGRTLRRAISELVGICVGAKYDDAITHGEASKLLVRYGIRPNATGVYVAARHSLLAELFEGTAWQRDHARALLRTPGATWASGVCFLAGKSRAVWVPAPQSEEPAPTGVDQSV
jgi:putative DNA primase/helicase